MTRKPVRGSQMIVSLPGGEYAVTAAQLAKLVTALGALQEVRQGEGRSYVLTGEVASSRLWVMPGVVVERPALLAITDQSRGKRA